MLYVGVEMEWMHIHEYLVREQIRYIMHIVLTSSPLIAPDDSPCCATCDIEEEGKGVYLLSTNTSDCPTILLVDDCVLELSENRTDILNLLKSYSPALVISACMVS